MDPFDRQFDQFEISWIDRGRPPREAPNPNFPTGIHIDSNNRPACYCELPYMTHDNIGTWTVECSKCGVRMTITMASRSDDPRSIMIPCKKEAS